MSAPDPRRRAWTRNVVLAFVLLVATVDWLVRSPGLALAPSPSDSRPLPTLAASGEGRPSASPPAVELPPGEAGTARGYLTTPGELEAIAGRAAGGEEPFATGVEALLDLADEAWDGDVETVTRCSSSDKPDWLDNNGGSPLLYAKAIAYHLTGEERYAREVHEGLEKIMSTVEEIELDPHQCRLNFAWGTPELVAAADLIEGYWIDETCVGPESLEYGDPQMGPGNCKERFQNWLVKNPYYVSSFAALASGSNWGAAGTTTMATVADYLWDRPEARLTHRVPVALNDNEWDEEALSPAEAYLLANRLVLDRMNGYRIELLSNDSCDYLEGGSQSSDWPPVKSQITETGIIPEDARREEYCNIPRYDGSYQNYPQIHIGNLVQQCELMLRRGDPSCYENVEQTDIPEYRFEGPDGRERTTHLMPGRGSLERAINAVIVDSDTEWRRSSALAVAYRYYRDRSRFGETEAWLEFVRPGVSAPQDLSFGDLTHALAPGDAAPLPPAVAPPRD